jgi:Holliday junction resolvase-like predicted endonuclease
MVQEVSIEFKRRYCGVFLARLIIYNDIKERRIIGWCRRYVVKMSIKETFDVVFTDINRGEKFSELTNTLSDNCTQQEVVKEVVGNFYKTSILNYRGYVTGAKKEKRNLYTERIAKSIFDNDLLTVWKCLVPVRTNHFVPDHSKECECIISTNRKEEILAKLLYRQGDVGGLGKILDYQTPLKNKNSDSYGKIDLLSYNEKDNLISIVELKYRPSVSDETLLRCILEAYTYYKLLELDQVKQKLNDENQQANLVDSQAELVILFDEGVFSKSDGGSEKNLMVSLDSSGNFEYPNKTIKTQQYKEIKGLGLLNENTQLYKLCKAILKQEEMLKQIRFLMLKRSGIQTANRLRDKDDNDSVEYYEYCTECLEIIKD